MTTNVLPKDRIDEIQSNEIDLIPHENECAIRRL